MQVSADVHTVPLIPFKQRVVLGLLLCRANRVVPVSDLHDALWGDAAPPTAVKIIQVYVSALRRLASPPLELLHTPPGYTLRIESDQLDALQFRELVRAGRRARRSEDIEAAGELLDRALALWCGPVLPELAGVARLATEARRLREDYLGVYEDWAEAQLSLGQPARVLDGVDELTIAHPFRERLRHSQMLALYRCGRRAEALAQFDTLRQAIARELGLEPSPVLQRLYDAILAADPGLDPSNAGWSSARASGGADADSCYLPPDVPDFTGRMEQVDTVLEILQGKGGHPVIGITGGIGVGKTALAVHCAHRAGAQQFPDGRVLVCLRSADGQARSETDVIADLLTGLGAAARSEQPRTHAATLRAAVAGRRVLFLLDDAVTEAQVRAIQAAAGPVGILVTSRRHLSGLESTRHVCLDPMSDAEATTLLGRIVGAERLATEPDAADRIIRACSGLPLLVRIIGAKLSALRHLSLIRYAERLDHEGELLDELVAGDLHVRPRLAAAYRDLTPADRVVLRGLAALAGPAVTAVQVAVALQTEVTATERAIERLVESHVAQAHVDRTTPTYDPRYTLAPLMRSFVHCDVNLTTLDDVADRPL
ncbi:MAG: BTAD domain-containing putative transcriptional regulator [Micromonosporaceae bacterium]